MNRTRKQVKMLDDLYKTAIVLITENYVTDKSSLPAGEAFQKLFGAMKKAGHHEVRLLDATGEPLNPDNAPKDAFEKAAIAALLKGKSGYEEVMEKNGKKFLRSATPIPVVLDKCIMCHDQYKAAKEKKQIIGSLGYTIPIE
ncbi:MAG: c-type heme family protein [Pirellulaceae bacterium]